MKKKILVVAGLLAMSGALTAQSVYPGQHAGKLKRETVAPMKVKSFDLKDVRSVSYTHLTLPTNRMV